MQPIHRKKFVNYSWCVAHNIVADNLKFQSNGTKTPIDLNALSTITPDKLAILDSMAAEVSTSVEASVVIDMTQEEFDAAGGMQAFLATMASQTGGSASAAQ